MTERFEQGSIEFAPAVMLTKQHDRAAALARWPDGGLELLQSDGEARLQANLAPTQLARDTYTLIRGKVLTGLSVEFAALAERMDGQQRVIERALVPFISIVDSPEYKLSTIEARAKGSADRPPAAARPRRFFL